MESQHGEVVASKKTEELDVVDSAVPQQSVHTEPLVQHPREPSDTTIEADAGAPSTSEVPENVTIAELSGLPPAYEQLDHGASSPSADTADHHTVTEPLSLSDASHASSDEAAAAVVDPAASEGAAGHDTTSQETTGQEAAGQEAVSQEAVSQEAVSHDAVSQEAAVQDTTSMDASSEDAAGHSEQLLQSAEHRSGPATAPSSESAGLAAPVDAADRDEQRDAAVADLPSGSHVFDAPQRLSEGGSESPSVAGNPPSEVGESSLAYASSAQADGQPEDAEPVSPSPVDLDGRNSHESAASGVDESAAANPVTEATGLAPDPIVRATEEQPTSGDAAGSRGFDAASSSQSNAGADSSGDNDTEAVSHAGARQMASSGNLAGDMSSEGIVADAGVVSHVMRPDGQGNEQDFTDSAASSKAISIDEFSPQEVSPEDGLLAPSNTVAFNEGMHVDPQGHSQDVLAGGEYVPDGPDEASSKADVSHGAAENLASQISESDKTQGSEQMISDAETTRQSASIAGVDNGTQQTPGDHEEISTVTASEAFSAIESVDRLAAEPVPSTLDADSMPTVDGMRLAETNSATELNERNTADIDIALPSTNEMSESVTLPADKVASISHHVDATDSDRLPENDATASELGAASDLENPTAVIGHLREQANDQNAGEMTGTLTTLDVACTDGPDDGVALASDAVYLSPSEALAARDTPEIAIVTNQNSAAATIDEHSRVNDVSVLAASNKDDAVEQLAKEDEHAVNAAAASDPVAAADAVHRGTDGSLESAEPSAAQLTAAEWEASPPAEEAVPQDKVSLSNDRSRGTPESDAPSDLQHLPPSDKPESERMLSDAEMSGPNLDPSTPSENAALEGGSSDATTLAVELAALRHADSETDEQHAASVLPHSADAAVGDGIVEVDSAAKHIASSSSSSDDAPAEKDTGEQSPTEKVSAGEANISESVTTNGAALSAEVGDARENTVADSNVDDSLAEEMPGTVEMKPLNDTADDEVAETDKTQSLDDNAEPRDEAAGSSSAVETAEIDETKHLYDTIGDELPEAIETKTLDDTVEPPHEATGGGSAVERIDTSEAMPSQDTVKSKQDLLGSSSPGEATPLDDTATGETAEVSKAKTLDDIGEAETLGDSAEPIQDAADENAAGETTGSDKTRSLDDNAEPRHEAGRDSIADEATEICEKSLDATTEVREDVAGDIAADRTRETGKASPISDIAEPRQEAGNNSTSDEATETGDAMTSDDFAQPRLEDDIHCTADNTPETVEAKPLDTCEPTYEPASDSTAAKTMETGEETSLTDNAEQIHEASGDSIAEKMMASDEAKLVDDTADVKTVEIGDEKPLDDIAEPLHKAAGDSAANETIETGEAKSLDYTEEPSQKTVSDNIALELSEMGEAERLDYYTESEYVDRGDSTADKTVETGEGKPLDDTAEPSQETSDDSIAGETKKTDEAMHLDDAAEPRQEAVGDSAFDHIAETGDVKASDNIVEQSHTTATESTADAVTVTSEAQSLDDNVKPGLETSGESIADKTPNTDETKPSDDIDQPVQEAPGDIAADETRESGVAMSLDDTSEPRQEVGDDNTADEMKVAAEVKHLDDNAEPGQEAPGDRFADETLNAAEAEPSKHPADLIQEVAGVSSAGDTTQIGEAIPFDENAELRQEAPGDSAADKMTATGDVKLVNGNAEPGLEVPTDNAPDETLNTGEAKPSGDTAQPITEAPDISSADETEASGEAKPIDDAEEPKLEALGDNTADEMTVTGAVNLLDNNAEPGQGIPGANTADDVPKTSEETSVVDVTAEPGPEAHGASATEEIMETSEAKSLDDNPEPEEEEVSGDSTAEKVTTTGEAMSLDDTAEPRQEVSGDSTADETLETGEGKPLFDTAEPSLETPGHSAADEAPKTDETMSLEDAAEPRQEADGGSAFDQIAETGDVKASDIIVEQSQTTATESTADEVTVTGEAKPLDDNPEQGPEAPGDSTADEMTETNEAERLEDSADSIHKVSINSTADEIKETVEACPSDHIVEPRHEIATENTDEMAVNGDMKPSDGNAEPGQEAYGDNVGDETLHTGETKSLDDTALPRQEASSDSSAEKAVETYEPKASDSVVEPRLEGASTAYETPETGDAKPLDRTAEPAQEDDSTSNKAMETGNANSVHVTAESQYDAASDSGSDKAPETGEANPLDDRAEPIYEAATDSMADETLKTNEATPLQDTAESGHEAPGDSAVEEPMKTDEAMPLGDTVDARHEVVGDSTTDDTKEIGEAKPSDDIAEPRQETATTNSTTDKMTVSDEAKPVDENAEQWREATIDRTVEAKPSDGIAEPGHEAATADSAADETTNAGEAVTLTEPSLEMASDSNADKTTDTGEEKPFGDAAEHSVMKDNDAKQEAFGDSTADELTGAREALIRDGSSESLAEEKYSDMQENVDYGTADRSTEADTRSALDTATDPSASQSPSDAEAQPEEAVEAAAAEPEGAAVEEPRSVDSMHENVDGDAAQPVEEAGQVIGQAVTSDEHPAAAPSAQQAAELQLEHRAELPDAEIANADECTDDQSKAEEVLHDEISNTGHSVVTGGAESGVVPLGQAAENEGEGEAQATDSSVSARNTADPAPAESTARRPDSAASSEKAYSDDRTWSQAASPDEDVRSEEAAALPVPPAAASPVPPAAASPVPPAAASTAADADAGCERTDALSSLGVASAPASLIEDEPVNHARSSNAPPNTDGPVLSSIGHDAAMPPKSDSVGTAPRAGGSRAAMKQSNVSRNVLQRPEELATPDASSDASYEDEHSSESDSHEADIESWIKSRRHPPAHHGQLTSTALAPKPPSHVAARPGHDYVRPWHAADGAQQPRRRYAAIGETRARAPVASTAATVVLPTAPQPGFVTAGLLPPPQTRAPNEGNAVSKFSNNRRNVRPLIGFIRNEHTAEWQSHAGSTFQQNEVARSALAPHPPPPRRAAVSVPSGSRPMVGDHLSASSTVTSIDAGGSNVVPGIDDRRALHRTPATTRRPHPGSTKESTQPLPASPRPPLSPHPPASPRSPASPHPPLSPRPPASPHHQPSERLFHRRVIFNAAADAATAEQQQRPHTAEGVRRRRMEGGAVGGGREAPRGGPGGLTVRPRSQTTVAELRAAGHIVEHLPRLVPLPPRSTAPSALRSTFSTETSDKRRDYFPEELRRLQRSMEREAERAKSSRTKGSHVEFGNSLEPYYDTAEVTLALQQEVQDKRPLSHTALLHYSSRPTALGLVDPWINLRMDGMLLPRIPMRERAVAQELYRHMRVSDSRGQSKRHPQLSRDLQRHRTGKKRSKHQLVDVSTSPVSHAGDKDADSTLHEQKSTLANDEGAIRSAEVGDLPCSPDSGNGESDQTNCLRELHSPPTAT